ncbi:MULTISPECIES: hypothetical protein [unclassified Microcoleus]|uniref:hypothetical protein n=1 Tax=unclassified Microcoleus TaxID=2642155 RepID=UPI002FCE7F50
MLIPIAALSILIIAVLKVRMSRYRLWLGKGKVRSTLRRFYREFAIARDINTI